MTDQFHTDTRSGLPDPDYQAEFYADVPTKRLIAWGIDVVLIGLITLVLVPFTLFTALFYLPALYLVVGFLYRAATIARRSATPGMRLAAIELRDGSGARLDPMGGLLHTIGYTISVAVFPLQLISIVLMLTTPRAQGLTDHVLGSAAVNRAAAV